MRVRQIKWNVGRSTETKVFPFAFVLYGIRLESSNYVRFNMKHKSDNETLSPMAVIGDGYIR